MLADVLPCNGADSGLLGVRLGVHPDKTRIVLDVTDTLNYKLSFLSNPNRLIVDLPNVEWRGQAGQLPAPAGMVQSLHPLGSQNGGVRLELRLTAPARITLADTLLPTGSAPARLFIDLVPAFAISTEVIEVTQAGRADKPAATETPPSTAAQPLPLPGPEPVVAEQPPPRAPPVEPSKPTQPVTAVQTIVPPIKPQRPNPPSPALSVAAIAALVSAPPPAKPEAPADRQWLVALDPGHGGKDPGTIGPAGTEEKDITFKMALELKEKLEATGRYKVFLTRDKDQHMALRERTERARNANADLFISLHADHIDQAELRGASVYTLSETASDTEAAALAAHANKEDLITGVDLSSQSAIVTSILIDLAQRETKNLSARFASILSEELAQRTLMLRNAHRFAGFVVLKAPDVPSVLVELGYLSNKEDEQALNSAGHRAQLCAAMLMAIERYFEWQRSVKQI
ncbi:MAG: N-acetylmuramoyl-L-alanine amidase [Dongiaceae bacterium]